MKKKTSELAELMREFLMNIAIEAMCLIERHIMGPARYPSLRFEFGSWLDGLAQELFGFAFEGSDEELRMALDQEIPYEYLNRRQIDHINRFAYANIEPDFTLLALPDRTT